MQTLDAQTVPDLTAMPQIGIIGAAIGTVGGFLVPSYLNYRVVRFFARWAPDFRTMLLRPALAVTIMAIVVYYAYGQSKIILGNSWATIISILVGVLVYLLVLVKTGTFRQ